MPDTSFSAGTNQPPANQKTGANHHGSRWLIVFSFGLAAALLYFTLRGLDWAAFWHAVRFGHYELLLLILPIASLNFFIRALRWSFLLQAEKKVSVVSVFWANMVGYLGNAYLPARAGELLRSVFLGRQKGLGTSFVLATALTERGLDVVALVIIGSIAMLSQGPIPPELENAVRFTAAAGLAGLAVILIMPYQEERVTTLINKSPLPEHLRGSVGAQISRFLLGMRSLKNMARLGAFIGLTIVIWLVDAIGTLIGVHIIGQNLNLAQALVLLAALGLSSAIPSTPGYVGVYQFVAVLVLVPFGFSRPEALAYILISQILGYLVISFWGLMGLWQINASTG